MLKKIIPVLAWETLARSKRSLIKAARGMVESLGYNIYPVSNYSSPLPNESRLRKNLYRWNKPSSLGGIKYDVEAFKKTLKGLVEKYSDEFRKLPAYEQSKLIGFGPGYTELDAFFLYMMIRELKPKKYLEVGSGLSTYYCSLAAKENLKLGSPVKITCVEPYPFAKLFSIPGIEVIKDEVQNTKLELFSSLEENDVLFIDSSHVLRIDGDTAFLYLEALPRLKKGVIIHIHDIPFPYNVPYPAELWVLGKKRTSPHWPVYWNEAMILQAFLAFNDSFEIIMSTPLIRYHDESFLKENVTWYKNIAEEPNTFSSIWLKKIK